MKRALLLSLRLLLTVFLLWWVFKNPKVAAGFDTLSLPPEPLWLLPAWLSAGLNELAGALRWWCCLRLAGVEISFTRATGLHFLGTFMSLFLPGSVGGDAAKIAYVMLWYPHNKLGGVLAVLMDRLSGLTAVMVWGGTVAALRGDWFRQTPATAVMLNGVLLFLGTVGVGLVLWYLGHRSGRLQRRHLWLPGREKILRISGIFDLFFASRSRAIAVLILAALCHAFTYGVYYSSARAYGAGWLLSDALSIMPVVDVVTMLPITLAGIGLRESTFQTLLAPLCGVDPATAVLISLTGFFIIATWALPGAGFCLWFRSPKRQEMEHA